MVASTDFRSVKPFLCYQESFPVNKRINADAQYSFQRKVLLESLKKQMSRLFENSISQILDVQDESRRLVSLQYSNYHRYLIALYAKLETTEALNVSNVDTFLTDFTRYYQKHVTDKFYRQESNKRLLKPVCLAIACSNSFLFHLTGSFANDASNPLASKNLRQLMLQDIHDVDAKLLAMKTNLYGSLESDSSEEILDTEPQAKKMVLTSSSVAKTVEGFFLYDKSEQGFDRWTTLEDIQCFRKEDNTLTLDSGLRTKTGEIIMKKYLPSGKSCWICTQNFPVLFSSRSFKFSLLTIT